MGFRENRRCSFWIAIDFSRVRLLETEEVTISAVSSLLRLSLEEANLREKCNIVVLSIKKPNGDSIFNPPLQHILEEDEILVVLGETDGLQCLRELTSK